MSMLSARDPDRGAGARQPGRASKPLRPRSSSASFLSPLRAALLAPPTPRQIHVFDSSPPPCAPACSRRPRHGGHSLGHAPYRQPKHDEHGEHGAPDEARDHGARRAVRTVVVEHRSTPTRLAAATCSGSKRESERASRVTRRASKGPFLKTTVVARLRQVLGLTLVKHVTRASRLHPLLAEASRRRARTGALRTYRSYVTRTRRTRTAPWSAGDMRASAFKGAHLRAVAPAPRRLHCLVIAESASHRWPEA